MGRRASRAGEGQALPCPSQCAFSRRAAICGAVASAVWPCQALLTGTVLLMCPAWGAHQAVGASGPGKWDVLPVDVRMLHTGHGGDGLLYVNDDPRKDAGPGPSPWGQVVGQDWGCTQPLAPAFVPWCPTGGS